jgi:hypothetical protein
MRVMPSNHVVDHDDHRDYCLCSVTSTDLSGSSSSSSSTLDGQDCHIQQHRIFIFEFAVNDEDTLDGETTTCNCHGSCSQRRHHCCQDLGKDSRFMWRKSYITSSSSTISELTYQDDNHDDSKSQPRKNQNNVRYYVPPRHSKLQQKQQQHPRNLSRFLPRLMQQRIDRLKALRPLPG